MTSKFETGHFINLSNFGSLISYLNTQPLYNPDANALKITSLTTLKENVEDATNNLVEEAAQLQQLVNDRQQEFQQMKKLAIRIIKYLEASSTDREAIKDVRTHFNELQSKKLIKTETINEDGSISIKKYSSSRLSFHSLAENFQKMIERIATMTDYAPTDPTITLTNLQTRYQSLHQTNQTVTAKYQAVSNARYNRDLLMYEKEKGLVDIALRVKKFAQYKFGMQSEQYDYINGLKFTNKQIRTQEIIENEEPPTS